MFLSFVYQGEPGIDGEAGASGPDGAKAGLKIRSSVKKKMK